MSIKKRLRREGAYLSIRLLRSLFKIVSAKSCVKFSPFIVRLLKFLFKKETEIMKRNLKLVYGDKDQNFIKRCIDGVYENILYGALEVLDVASFPEGFKFSIEEDKEKIIEELIKSGKKILWVSAHIGNWEFLPFYFSKKGYKITVVARRLYDERLNKMLEEFRKEINVIYREEAETGFSIIRAIKSNDILGILVDQKIKGVESIDSIFLGIPSKTASGFARIAKAFSMPVVVGVNIREKPFSFKILISDPIFTEALSEKEIVDKVNAKLTEFIMKYPEQWMWFHKRWD